MKQVLCIFIALLLFNNSCDKSETLKASNELIGIWRFENVLDGFGGNTNKGSLNFFYENFEGLIVEFTDKYKYQIRREETSYIINSGCYYIIGSKIFIAKNANLLLKKNEYLKIKKSNEAELLVEHILETEIDRECLSILFSTLLFSRKE